MLLIVFLISLSFASGVQDIALKSFGETLASANAPTIGAINLTPETGYTTCTMTGDFYSGNTQSQKLYAALRAGDRQTSNQCKIVAYTFVKSTEFRQLCVNACVAHNENNFISTGYYCNSFNIIPCSSYNFATGVGTDCTTSGGANGKMVCEMLSCPVSGGGLGSPLSRSIELLTATAEDVSGDAGPQYVETSKFDWWSALDSDSNFTTNCLPPTKSPTRTPTGTPTNPTMEPTKMPTKSPSNPTLTPTNLPTTRSPTKTPTRQPGPSKTPSKSPTNYPTDQPTKSPSKMPTLSPTTENEGYITKHFISANGITCQVSSSHKATFTGVNDYVGCYLKCRDEHATTASSGETCIGFHFSGSSCNTFSECTNPQNTPAIGTLYMLATSGVLTRTPSKSPTKTPTLPPTMRPTAPTPQPTPQTGNSATNAPTDVGGLNISLDEKKTNIVLIVGGVVGGLFGIVTLRGIYNKYKRSSNAFPSREEGF